MYCDCETVYHIQIVLPSVHLFSRVIVYSLLYEYKYMYILALCTHYLYCAQYNTGIQFVITIHKIGYPVEYNWVYRTVTHTNL